MKEKDLVLVIDMQNAYAPGGAWECASIQRAKERILEILEKKKDADVVFTRFLYNPEASGVWKEYNRQYEKINSDAYANSMMPAFSKYLDKFLLYSKSQYSCLSNDAVREKCRNSKRVILCGVVAECCVLSTLFALVDEGIMAIYLEDAISGLTKETERSALEIAKTLSPLHISIMTAEEYLQEE